jgi:hypothetical protein
VKSGVKYDEFDKRMYAKWTDVVTPVQATIEDMRVEEMPRTKTKELVAWFPEEQFRFGVPLTAKVNRRALAKITGSEDPMDAIGTTVELYNDPTVRNPQTGEYGAVRIRIPRNGANGGEKPATTSPHPPVPLSQPHADRPAKSLDQVNDDLAAATDDEMPY